MGVLHLRQKQNANTSKFLNRKRSNQAKRRENISPHREFAAGNEFAKTWSSSSFHKACTSITYRTEPVWLCGCLLRQRGEKVILGTCHRMCPLFMDGDRTIGTAAPPVTGTGRRASAGAKSGSADRESGNRRVGTEPKHCSLRIAA